MSRRLDREEEPKGLTVVAPWFGTDSPGGAERLARSLAERMAERGWRVSLAATTNAAHHGWWEESNFAPGRQPWPAFESGFAPDFAGNEPELWRFAPDPRLRRRYDELNRKLLNRLPVRLEEEIDFFRNSINSRALLSWVVRERPNDLVAILPYPFGLSFFATALFADRAVLVPCLHREGYAMTRLVGEMLERAGGLAFLSREEEALAEALADIAKTPRIVAGAGLDGTDEPPPSGEERARARAKFSNGEPYLLYLGWQDPAKGVSFLYECCRDLVRLSREGFFPGKPPRLLLAGPGHVPIPPGLQGKVFDLRYLSPEDKRLALAGAEWLVHPSERESFGLALMEAWLAETPALVNALCATTRGHVSRAGGGLYFVNGEELAGAIAWGRENPHLKRRMGQLGRAHVLDNYAWESLAERWDAFFAERLAAFRSRRAAFGAKKENVFP